MVKSPYWINSSFFLDDFDDCKNATMTVIQKQIYSDGKSVGGDAGMVFTKPFTIIFNARIPSS